jgi:regulator of sigma E protease
VLAIDGQRVNSWEDLATEINKKPQEEIELKIKRNNTTMNIKLTPKLDEKSGRGLIGIAPVVQRQKVSLFKSIWLGIQQTGLYIYAIAIGLWQMITAQISAQVSGPVEIAKMVGRASNTGMLRLLELAALISVNLGFMNLLPIPALDGGRLVFLGLEVVRGKPIDPEKEGTAHMVGFALLILLLLVVTVKDIFM